MLFKNKLKYCKHTTIHWESDRTARSPLSNNSKREEYYPCSIYKHSTNNTRSKKTTIPEIL